MRAARVAPLLAPILAASCGGTPVEPAQVVAVEASIPAAPSRERARPAARLRGSPIAVDAGAACVVRRDGRVWCWGKPSWVDAPRRPFPLPGIADAVAVAIVQRAVCALVKSGEVLCHGKDLRIDDDTVATRRLGDATDVVDLVAAAWRPCVLHRGGAVDCFVPPDVTSDARGRRIEVNGFGGAVRLLPYGPGRLCALLDDGRVSCWSDTPEKPVAELVPEVADVVDLTGGDEPCSVRRDGTLVCKSYRGWQPVKDHPPVAMVAQTAKTRCVLLRDGGVRCIGDSDGYSLSPDTAGPSGLKARALALDHSTACALLEDDGVACWGKNQDGLLGQGVDGIVRQPRKVPLSGPAHDLDTERGVTCAALASSVECWGRPEDRDERRYAMPAEPTSGRHFAPWVLIDERVDGIDVGIHKALLHRKPAALVPLVPKASLGDGHRGPQELKGLDGGATLSLAWSDVMAVSPSGALAEWRDGTVTPVPGIRGARAVARDYVLLRDGSTVKLRGRQPPAPTGLDVRARAIATNEMSELCAIVEPSGHVRCHDDGRPYRSLAPFTSTLGPVRSIALGRSSGDDVLCAVLVDGSVRCGMPPGPGYPTVRAVLQDLSSLRDVREVVVGNDYACALGNDGAVHCWGSNEGDRIGEHPQTYAPAPVRIAFDGG